MILKTVDLTKDFGSLRAVDKVNLEVSEGETRAIIGPNGAGKSTLLDLITNRTKPTSGKVYFMDQDITNLPCYTITSKKICKCFQISKLFPELSVYENVEIACISQQSKVYNMYASRNKAIHERVRNILSSISLASMADNIACYLSYGDQRRLEIGITLAMEPILLLLDEPTAGISRAEGLEVMRMIKKLAAERSITTIFIEHDMDIVFNFADIITVMHYGSILATGTPGEIINNKLVQKVYLGDMRV